MNTTNPGTYRVTLNDGDYTKSVGLYNGFIDIEYRVVRISAEGKRIAARLNPSIHRAAISRVERALADQK